jgi:hypothetical protein
VQAVKDQFLTVATDASATVLKGVDKESLNSLLTNAIAPLQDPNASNYNPGWTSRVIFLVDNYNQDTGEADAIGVLTVAWNLKILDYKEKKSTPQHQTWLDVKCWSIMYSDLQDMYADKLFIEQHFKNQAFPPQGIPIPPRNVKIYDVLPPADADTFKASLPVLATTNQLKSIVMYAPNLQNVGCIDNITRGRTPSTRSGFSFSTEQTFSVEASFEASAEVVKVGAKIGSA